MSLRNSELNYFSLYIVFLLRYVYPVNCFRQWNKVMLFYTSVESGEMNEV